MAADNTLGAPTEGLGQTVTFAGNSKVGVPQVQAVQRQAIRNNATGGAAVRTAEALQVQAPKGDTFFQTIAKLGGDIIKPMVEAERTLKFYEGVNQAARNQAIEEIVDEQPWYSKMFGSSSLVDGARAHTASAKATALATELEVDMPNFRKLSDNEAVRYVTDKVTKLASTGDSTVNAMIVQQATAAIAPVLKNRTKASINFLQEQRQEATEASYGAQFANVQAVFNASQQPGATVDAGDALMTAIGSMSAMVREDGVSPELHSKMISSAAIKAANNGNLQAYQIIKASGKFDELTPQDQYQLTRAHSIAVNEAKGNIPVAFSNQLREFKVLSTTSGASMEDIQAKADSVNKEWQRLSGDTGNYLQARDVIAEQMQLDAVQRQQADAAARARERATTLQDKEQAQVDWITSAFAAASNYASPTSYLDRLDAKDQQAVFDHARAKLGNKPEEYAAFIANQAESRVYDKALEHSHESALSAAMATNSAAALHQYYTTQYLPLIKASGGLGEVNAQHYAGRHKDVIARYHSIASQYPNADALAKEGFAIFARQPVPTVDLGKKGKEVASELSSSETLSFLGRQLGMDTVPLVNPEGLASLITPNLSKVLKTPEAIEAYKRENRDLTVLGGHYWTKPAGTTRVDDWLTANPNKDTGGASSNELNRATNFTIKQYAEKWGIEDGLQLGQMADVNGVPHVMLWGMGSDRKVKMTFFSAADIHTTWAKREETLAAEHAATMVPDITSPRSVYERAQANKPK